MAYVGLFLSIRSRDWQLRMASMKLIMAPMFTAFDHQMYQKPISDHISDTLIIPEAVLVMFQQGAFMVNISGRPWHSIGIDEAHEMCINKQCKIAILKLTEDYINE